MASSPNEHHVLTARMDKRSCQPLARAAFENSALTDGASSLSLFPSHLRSMRKDRDER